MAQVQSQSSLAPVIGLVSERFLTGGSLLMQGRIGEGLAHAVLGMVAYTTFGLPAMLLVSANSFAQAQTGSNLLQLASQAAENNVTPTKTASGNRPS